MRYSIIIMLLTLLSACGANDHHWRENAFSFTLKNSGYTPMQQGRPTQGYYGHSGATSTVGVGSGGLSQAYGQ